MTEITVAALQLGFTADIDKNIANVSRLVREAGAHGAAVLSGLLFGWSPARTVAAFTAALDVP